MLIFHDEFIHQDIKPGNLMYDDYGNIYFIDFGMSQKLYQVAEQSTIGTFVFNSPEKKIVNNLFLQGVRRNNKIVLRNVDEVEEAYIEESIAINETYEDF